MISFLANLLGFRKNKNDSPTSVAENNTTCRDAILESDKYILESYITTSKEIPLSSLVKYPNDSKKALSLQPLKLMYKNESYGVLLSEVQYKVLQDLILRLECKKRCTVIDRINAITTEDCMLYTDSSK